MSAILGVQALNKASEGSDQRAAGSEGLGAQLGQSGGLVLHGVVLLPVLPGLGQRHDEELLAQRVLHLVVVGGLVEVAGEELGQQLLEHVGAQEQQAAEQHPEQQSRSEDAMQRTGTAPCASHQQPIEQHTVQLSSGEE